MNYHKRFSLLVFNSIAVSGVMPLAVIFYTAFFSPTESTLVFVNRFGEGLVEAFILIPSMLFCCLMSILVSFKVLWGDDL